VSVMKCFNS